MPTSLDGQLDARRRLAIVLADFAQLTPDRSATVVTATGATSLTVTVSGRSHTGIASSSGRPACPRASSDRAPS